MFHFHPTYTTQTVNDGVNTASWTTVVTKTSEPVSAYAITAPNGTKTTTNLYTSGWQTGLVSSVVVSNGSTTLRTSTNSWTQDGGGNPVLASVTTALNDSGQQSKVEFIYTTNGNVSEVKEYDWGPSLFRKTQTDYETGSSYASNHILDRPKQIRVYDAGGNLKARMDFAYDGGTLTNLTGAAQHDDTNYGSGFTTRGNLTSIVRYPNLPSTSGSITRNFVYNTLGNLRTADVDCCQQEQWTFGSATQYAYPTSIVRGPSGQQLTTNLSYDANTGLLLSETDPNNQSTTYTYNDSMLRLTAITDALSTSTTFSFDDDSAQFKSTATTSIDASTSVVTVTTTDGAGRPVKRETKNSTGSTTFSIVETQYDAMGRVFKVSNPYTTGTALWTETQYDTLSRPIKVIPPDGSASANNTQFAYAGNKTTVTDPAGKQRATLADAFGRVVQVHEPGFEDGRPGTGSVTITGSPQFVEEWGEPYCVEYTMDGFCIQWQQDPITYWDAGTVSITVNGLNKNTSYSQSSSAAALAATLASAFSNDSNSAVTATASGGVISFIAKVGGPATNYSLSASVTSNDPGRFTPPSFAATPSGSTLTGGSATPSADTPLVTTSTYDVLDNLVLVGQGVQSRSYAYDSMGRLKQVVTPEGGQVDYTYNAFSLVATRIDPRGVTTSYQYDGLNRVVGVGYTIQQGSSSTAMPNNCTPSGGSAANVCFAYGASAASNNNGRMTTMTDGVGSESYTYDALGQVTQVQKVISSTTYTMSYAYNRVGAVTSITYPSTRVVTHSFDAIGRLSQISSGGTNYFSSPTYNAAGQATAFTYGNSVQASFTYNARLQLATLAYSNSGGNFFQLTYGYGSANNGQIQSIDDHLDNNRDTTFTYDGWGRLKAAVNNQWNLSWVYDRYGNRKQQNANPGQSMQLTISASNNRISLIGTTSTEYDAAGNLTKDDLKRYRYDGEHRLVKLRDLADTQDLAEYTYDGNGLRVKRNTSGATTIYIFSGASVIAEYASGAGTGSPTREYVYAGSQLLATIESGATKYHHADHLSTRATTDSSGAVVATQGHLPFGESWYTTGTAGKKRFTSYERDLGANESGSDYAVFRFHMSRLGRFNRPDPVAGSVLDPQSLNRYAYVRNDPINMIDPLGLDGFCIMDGIGVPCDYAYGFLASGAAVQAPGGIGATGYGAIWAEGGWHLFRADFAEGGRIGYFGLSAAQVEAWGLQTQTTGPQVAPFPPGLRNGTPEEREAFIAALFEARKRLAKSACAKLFGPNAGSRLFQTDYRFLPLGRPTVDQKTGNVSVTGAQTNSGFSVFINSQGPFVNQNMFVPGKGLVTLDLNSRLRGPEFGAFILLHELGHQLSVVTGFLPDAGNRALNTAQSQRVLRDCF